MEGPDLTCSSLVQARCVRHLRLLPGRPLRPGHALGARTTLPGPRPLKALPAAIPDPQVSAPNTQTQPQRCMLRPTHISCQARPHRLLPGQLCRPPPSRERPLGPPASFSADASPAKAGGALGGLEGQVGWGGWAQCSCNRGSQAWPPAQPFPGLQCWPSPVPGDGGGRTPTAQLTGRPLPSPRMPPPT